MNYFIVWLLITLMACTEKETEAEKIALKIREKYKKGVLSGFDCAVVHELCPENHRNSQTTFGLFNEKTENLSFLTNIPQSFLKQYFLDTLYVKGNVFAGYPNTIEPVEIEIDDAKGNRIKILTQGQFLDPYGHFSTFENGGIVNGVWMCDDCVKHYGD